MSSLGDKCTCAFNFFFNIWHEVFNILQIVFIFSIALCVIFWIEKWKYDNVGMFLRTFHVFHIEYCLLHRVVTRYCPIVDWIVTNTTRDLFYINIYREEIVKSHKIQSVKDEKKHNNYWADRYFSPKSGIFQSFRMHPMNLFFVW